MKHLLTSLLLLLPLVAGAQSFRVANSIICYDAQESKQVKRAVTELCGMDVNKDLLMEIALRRQISSMTKMGQMFFFSKSSTDFLGMP